MPGQPPAAAGRRLQRAREAMGQAGLDALLLFSGPNLTYLSGSSVSEMTAGRAWYLVVPRRAAPVLLVQAWRARQARVETWVEDIRAYTTLSAVPVAELDAAWREIGLAGGRVGVEVGSEMKLGITARDLEELRAHFSATSFEDASPLLWRLRMVKDADEVALLRRAGAITAEAYLRTFSAIHAGTPASEAVWRMKAAMLELGGSAPWVLASAGRGNYAFGTEVVDGRPLEPGDMVWFDAGCAAGGYWSDYSRAAVVGPASPAQRELQAAVHEATRTGVELVRPGRPVAEIAAVCNEAVARLAGPGLVPLSTLAGRIGHGLGLDVTELPHLAEHDPTVLEPGMAITIEPGIATDDGTFHVEENVVVTGEGHEVLSTAPWELAQL